MFKVDRQQQKWLYRILFSALIVIIFLSGTLCLGFLIGLISNARS